MMPQNTTITHIFFSLVICSLALCVGAQEHDQRTLAYRGSGTWSGHVYIAAFGDPMIRNKRFQLLRPPPGEDLCSDIPINDPLDPALNFTTQFLDYENQIGLLIPRGRGACSEEVQTLVALKIQKKIPALRFLIIHGTDRLVGSTAVTMNVIGGDNGAYSGIGVMYMAYNEFTQINKYIEDQTIEQRSASPYLLDPTSGDWDFWVSVTGRITIRTDVDGAIEAEVFYWLRLVLFIILIITPCFRACYLWYAGGGRMHWRRDENGRIIGILYVPPMPIRLWMHRNPNQAGESISQKLSEEQFETLPIIKYQTNKKYMEDPSESGFVNNENEQDLELGVKPLNDEEQLGKDEEHPCLQLQRTQDTLDMNLVPSLDSLSDTSDDGASSPPASPVAISPKDDSNSDGLTTTCTMCSICIDDFEAGEELVLLPRCKHAFHKECIHPWLLERQGCCPLCKVKVLGDGSDDTESSSLEPPPDASPAPLPSSEHTVAVNDIEQATNATQVQAEHEESQRRVDTVVRREGDASEETP